MGIINFGVTVYPPKARILEDREDSKENVAQTYSPCRESLPDADSPVYHETGQWDNVAPPESLVSGGFDWLLMNFGVQKKSGRTIC